MAALEEKKPILESSDESEVIQNTDSGQESPEKSGRFQKRVFVPNYEPIQTRKRAKLSHDAMPSPDPETEGHSIKKEHGRKMPRTRLTKDEVFTPYVGPKPRAVPKSLLILEPELLPRTIKKKQIQMTSGDHIHTPAKDPSVSWTLTNQANQPQTVTVIAPSTSDYTTPLVVSSPALLESSEGGNPANRRQELTMTQSENGTYIITTMTGDGESGGFITVTDGQISAVEKMADAEGQTVTVIAESCDEQVEVRSDTPTSLLLLAEAAYPSTELTLPSVSSVTQSPQRIVQTSAAKPVEALAGKVSLSKALPATSLPTFVTVSCPKDSSTILTSSSEGQIPSLIPTTTTSQAKQWTCTVCGELMSDTEREQHLKQHLDTVEEEDFICETCGEQLKDEEDLELHMAVEHDEEEGDGSEGMDDFEDDEDEESSKDTEKGAEVTTVAPVASIGNGVFTSSAGNSEYVCDQCGETFFYAAYLRHHVKTVHANAGAVFTCSLCPKSFTSESELEIHNRLHQKPGISFKCIRCSQSFPSAPLLSKHARSCLRVAIHTPRIISKRIRRQGSGQHRSRANSHVCTVCDRAFTSEVYLKAHLPSHQAGQDAGNTFQRKQELQCLYCQEKFHHLGPLKEHMLAQHPKAFPFKCSICQRGFSRDSSRLAHEHTHQTLKLHVCSQCGEGFTLQTYLNRHIKYRHLKPVKFPCSVCQKEFVRQADLIKHMRVHTGEKPYVCEQCNHGFSQQSNYRYHMMRHRGEKPHVCPMCNKGFRVPSHLKMHMQQHLNERFTCPYCRKVFSQNRYLNRHLRTHTKGKQSKGTEHLAPAATVPSTDAMDTVVVYETPPAQPFKTEQQVIVDSVADVSEQVVVQDGEGESIIQFVMQDKEAAESETQPKEVTVIDAEGNPVYSTTVTITSETCTDSTVSTAAAAAAAAESSQPDVTEEQAYVNTDEGTRVVVGAFTEGEGGSMEDGNVTLPFRALTQILGGKNYKCDVCSESFGIRPNAMYNMIHTAHNHILVINLNDHHQQGQGNIS